MPALAATTHDDPVLKRSKLVADAEEDAAPPRLPHSWRLPVALLSIGWALAFAVLTACAAALNLAGASFSSPSFHTLPLAVLVSLTPNPLFTPTPTPIPHPQSHLHPTNILYTHRHRPPADQ